ncbi:GAF domain-containing sensor histidine kinase [Alkalicoccobacillus murimartini]|uniref:histidine kinase n=1 Tax=Alkalicoccobacillus murimartini TaxID=171685 RepID=A0ABT9YJ49_9BACI|nr:GAF domain-containing sensor histidine kinase [Alkalicoccobacillus murimartini]MDQ0207628.1 signal transduction histidine kinase [Alkalicoccobacillus murimartini]
MDILRALKEISKTLNEGTDVASMLTPVLTKLLHITGFSSSWIFLVDEKGRHTLAAKAGVPPALSREDCGPLKKGGCWCKSQFMKGELSNAVNMLECQRLERAVEQDWGDTNHITHHATIPILAGDKPLGILNVASPGKLHFQDDELHLLETIGYQIGTAINRVQLYERESRRAFEFSQLSGFLQRLHTISAQSSNQELIQEMKSAFQFDEAELETAFAKKPIVRVQGQTIISEEMMTQLMDHLHLFKERQRLLELEDTLTRREERQQLANDLHDSVNQLLFSLQLRLKGMSLRLTDEKTKNELSHLTDIVKEALKELKEVIQVRRNDGDDRSLSTSIRRYGDLVGIEVHLTVSGRMTFSESQQEEVYRIVQEAINNTKKYAGTSAIHISFQTVNQHRQLIIADDGIGFDEQASIYPGSLGLKSIRSRVHKLQGKAVLLAKKGEGTRWEITFPLERGGVS